MYRECATGVNARRLLDCEASSQFAMIFRFFSSKVICNHTLVCPAWGDNRASGPEWLAWRFVGETGF
jgi:hypothetical protein